MSKNEKTANDSYLIVKGEEKEMKKISYRGNLIEEFKDDDAVYSKIQHVPYDGCKRTKANSGNCRRIRL